MPAREGGTVDHGTDFDRLARTFTCQRNQRVGRVCGVRLSPTGAARVPKDAVGVRLPCRAEASASVRRQTGLEPVRAVGIGQLVRSSFDVEAPRPRGVVGLGAGPHDSAPVAEALQARRAGRFQELRFRGGIGAGGSRDLGSLGRRQLPGAERGIRLGQSLERERRLQGSAGGANRLARGLGDPMGGASMATFAPCIRLRDAARAERFERRTDPFTAGRDLDERSSSASVEAVRIERTRDRFDIAEGPT